MYEFKRKNLYACKMPDPHYYLSYDVAVIQWITSCHKNRTTTRVIKLWRVCVTSLATSVSKMRFHIELMFIFKG